MNCDAFILDPSCGWMKKHNPVISLFERLQGTLSLADIGAADGRICRAYECLHPDAETLAVDVNWPVPISDIDTLTVTDGKPIPLSDNSYDIVTCLFTLNHSSNPWLLSRECFRIAKKIVIFGEGLITNRPDTVQEWLTLIGGQPAWTLRYLRSVQGELMPGFICTYSPTGLDMAGAPSLERTCDEV